MIARITDRVFEPDDDALGQNEVPYLLKDLYTVAGLADERGWPVERYDYDAYGKVHMNRCAVLPWAADFDGDGDVDQNDLTVFLDAYGGCGQASNGPRGWRADLDGDGDVDGSDYVLFADAYNGAGDPPRPPNPTVSVGSMAITTGSMVVSRVGNPYFFTGRRLDVMDKQDAGTPHHFTDDYAGLQLYDYRARTMDPVLGRFMQRDPLRYEDSVNLYQYAKSVPLGLVDSQGLKSNYYHDQACCNGKKYDVTEQCCENGNLVDKVTIWQCRRRFQSYYWLPIEAHCYVCCDGPNSKCFGFGVVPNNDNAIGVEPLWTGSCTSQEVCPRQKEKKCNNPKPSRPYSFWTYNCCDWAYEDTQSDTGHLLWPDLPDWLLY